jgi:hypothetical protein
MSKGNKLFLALALLVAILFWIFTPTVTYWMLILFRPNNPPLGDYSQWGDMYGSVSSLFSALALGGAIYALILQTRELEDTRKELKSSAESQKILTEMQALIALIRFKKVYYEETQAELSKMMFNKAYDDPTYDRVKAAYSNLWQEGLEDYYGYARRLEALLEAVSEQPAPSSELKQKNKAKLEEMLEMLKEFKAKHEP